MIKLTDSLLQQIINKCNSALYIYFSIELYSEEAIPLRIRKTLDFRDCCIAAIFYLKMASAVQTSIQHSFEFTTGLRGYHVYKNTENWKPFVGQEISLKRELSNEHGRFAVAGKVLLPNKLARVVVGHMERSCYQTNLLV